MDNTGLDCGVWPHGTDRIRQTFDTVTASDQHIGKATVLELGEHCHPMLRAFTLRWSKPDLKDVTAAIQIDTDRYIHRPVGDLGVAYFGGDRVNQHHRID